MDLWLLGSGGRYPHATPAPGHCPNGTCETNEDCDSCPADCGERPVISTPTPIGTITPTPTPTPLSGSIRVRAMQVSAADTSCTAVSSGTGITGTVHQFTPSSASQPTPQTQSGSSYSIFTSLIPRSYTINSQAPAQYVLARVCWNEALSGSSGENDKSKTLVPGDVLTWDLGYPLGTAWSQAQGGDVYASGTLKSCG